MAVRIDRSGDHFDASPLPMEAQFSPIFGLSVAALESGLKVYGEGRGLAVSDFDHDGRLDVLMAQNSNAAKLYRNVRGRPSLRVKLEGPLTNPNAIGAMIRLVYRDRMGSAREIHAGSGYWVPGRRHAGFWKLRKCRGPLDSLAWR